VVRGMRLVSDLKSDTSGRQPPCQGDWADDHAVTLSSLGP
jgi:hypothetical protein